MAEKYIYGRNCMSDHNHVPHAKNRAGVPQGSASAEAAVLQKLMPEYVSLYRIEANSGEYEILRLEGNTNAAELVKESWHPYEDFDEYTSQYARRFILPDTAFDLTELLGSVNREAQIKAEEKNVSYAMDWERADLPFICLLGNPVYAARLLTAIADNAVKFTEPGGCVRVWCEKKEIKGKQIVYEFGCEDNGIGMSEEFLPHAFEMFSQEKETSRTGYEGSGLGLAIARELSERLGGSIGLTSQKGTGTTVKITLPFRISDREALALCPTRKSFWR